MFKKGDIVKWNKNSGLYATEINARAIVTKDVNPGDKFVYVKWTDKKSHGQENGGYDVSDFILVKSRKELDSRLKVGDKVYSVNKSVQFWNLLDLNKELKTYNVFGINNIRTIEKINYKQGYLVLDGDTRVNGDHLCTSIDNFKKVEELKEGMLVLPRTYINNGDDIWYRVPNIEGQKLTPMGKGEGRRIKEIKDDKFQLLEDTITWFYIKDFMPAELHPDYVPKTQSSENNTFNELNVEPEEEVLETYDPTEQNINQNTNTMISENEVPQRTHAVEPLPVMNVESPTERYYDGEQVKYPAYEYDKNWSVTFNTLDYGYVVNVGCKSFAITSKELLIKLLTQYINNPRELVKAFNEGTLFNH